MNLLRRPGWTLLELILALGLSVVVIMLINSAMQIYYHSLNKVQASTEQDQLGRALLRRISDDLRAAVRYEEFDSSGLIAIPKVSSTDTSTSSSGSSGSSGNNTPTTTTPMTTTLAPGPDEYSSELRSLLLQ